MKERPLFGTWLEGQIYDRGYSKRTLARLLRVTPASVTHWTNGDTEPTGANIDRLADLLGVSRYEIYLRLGRLEGRGGLDERWEILWHELAGTEADYQAAVHRALEAMNDLWYRRQRRRHVVFEINLREVMDARPLSGLRSGSESTGHEMLLYFGPLDRREPEGWLMLSGVLDPDQETVILTGEHSANHPLLRAAIQFDGQEVEGVIRGQTFSFSPLPTAEAASLAPLHLEFQPGP